MARLRSLIVAGALAVPLIPQAFAEPLGTAAHEKAPVPRFDRFRGSQDWTQRGADVPDAAGVQGAWEEMIERHGKEQQRSDRSRRRREDRPVREQVKDLRRSDSPQGILDTLYGKKPSVTKLRTEVPWTTGGFRPSRAYHKAFEPQRDRIGELLAQRIPGHMDPIDLRSRDSFGEGVIEIAEAIKRALAEDGAGLREEFSGGPYEVRELIVKSRAPNFFPHPYGIGLRFRVVLRGTYRSDQGWHSPLNFFLDVDILAGEDGLVRADVRPDWDASDWAQAGATPDLDQYLLIATQRVANAYGPLELQAIEARIRDLVREVLPLRRPAPGRKQPNPYHQEAYVPLALKSATWKADLDGNGMPDEVFKVLNLTRRITRGPIARGGPRRFDFQQYAGWELYRGDTKILARTEGRLKFALYGDTDGDGLPDLILVEDRAKSRVSHHPHEPAHQYYLRPSVYFLDGQDMARDVFELGPVRFDFPPGADGSEIRAARLTPRIARGMQRDWDVELELFDPEGRILRHGLVFDRYPANRKAPQDVGFQRAEFVGVTPGRTRGVRFRVNFQPGSESVDKAGLKAIQEAWEKVGTGFVVKARLVGHACSQNSYAHNLELGKKRARAVGSELAHLGVRPSRVKIESRGEYEPAATNATPEGAAENRRVDGWLVVQPAPADRPPWYGRVGVERTLPPRKG